MGTFREKFGLDYLRKANEEGPRTAEQQPQKVPAGMDEALLAWGARVVEVLNNSPDKKARLFDILDKLDVRIDVLLPVIQSLVSNEYLTKIEADKKGNDVFQLTARGQRLQQLAAG